MSFEALVNLHRIGQLEQSGCVAGNGLQSVEMKR